MARVRFEPRLSRSQAWRYNHLTTLPPSFDYLKGDKITSIMLKLGKFNETIYITG